ncbi:TrbC/VirB2 family protein [Thermus sp.]|uniref:TrbC/VirB2 family protein n=1 Tax=Thermus sp. TaxID=275 RepID=UPI003D13F711
MKAVLAKAKRFLGTEHGRFLALALAAGLMLFLGVAEAETTNPADQAFGNVANVICTIVGYLKGPVGLGIIILMFAVGGISLAIGGRNAMPLMIGAGVGGIIVAAAPFFAKMFFGGTVSASYAPACTGLF